MPDMDTPDMDTPDMDTPNLPNADATGNSESPRPIRRRRGADAMSQFPLEYIIDFNATQAAIRSGANPRDAARRGTIWMRNPAVREAVDREIAARRSRTNINADNVLREIARIAFSDIGEVVDFSGSVPKLKEACHISDEARRTIRTMKFKNGDVIHIDFHSKMEALESCMKHLGLTKEPDSLEKLLAFLPGILADGIRQALAGQPPEINNQYSAITSEPTDDKNVHG